MDDQLTRLPRQLCSAELVAPFAANRLIGIASLNWMEANFIAYGRFCHEFSINVDTREVGKTQRKFVSTRISSKLFDSIEMETSNHLFQCQTRP